MGLLDKIFGSSKAAEPDAVDVEAKRAQLGALSAALVALVRRLRNDFPVENPGLQGRIDDLARAAREADELAARTSFNRQDLFDFGTTVRPLYRGQAPEAFAGLTDENERVVHALDALLD